jgi:hypothetical protein
MRQAVMKRAEQELQRIFDRHNEICNGEFCTLSLLEDCMAEHIVKCIETNAESLALKYR